MNVEMDGIFGTVVAGSSYCRLKDATVAKVRAALQEGVRSGYLEIPHVPIRGRLLVGHAWEVWCQAKGCDRVVLLPKGKTAEICLTIARPREMSDAAQKTVRRLAGAMRAKYATGPYVNGRTVMVGVPKEDAALAVRQLMDLVQEVAG